MQIRSLGDYGGPFSDLTSVVDPETELAASQFNTMAEDVAQLTRTHVTGVIKFNTNSGASGASTSVVGSRLSWGTGVTYYPTVTKIMAGKYTVTLSTTYEDDLDVVETVSLFAAQASLTPVTPYGVCLSTATGNTATVWILDETFTASDLGGGREVTVVLF